MLTKLERARQLRYEALKSARVCRVRAEKETELVAAYWTGEAEQATLEAEMYGDLIAKYEGMSEETI